MNRTLLNIVFAIGTLAVFIACGILFNSWKDKQLIKETTLRVESEMRFKQKVIEAIALTKQKDSLANEIKAKQVWIDYLENNPTVIIQKNDAAHININAMDAYNSIILFTNNTAKYSDQRARYSLHRFDKHN